MKQKELIKKAVAVATAIYATPKDSYCEFEENEDYIKIILVEEKITTTLALFLSGECCISEEDYLENKDEIIYNYKLISEIDELIKFSTTPTINNLFFKKLFNTLCNYYCANHLLKDTEFEVTDIVTPETSLIIIQTDQYQISSDYEATFVIKNKYLREMVVSYSEDLLNESFN